MNKGISQKWSKIIIYVLLGFIFWMVLISILADISTSPYITDHLGNFFNGYEIGNLIAIDVVIWTFTVTMGTYYLSILKKSEYGVRKIWILAAQIGTHVLRIFIVIIALELLLLIFATILEWRITIVMASIIEYLTMIVAFFQIYVVSSYTNVVEQVKDNYIVWSTNPSKDAEVILEQMIANMNYKKDKNLRALQEILEKLTVADVVDIKKAKEIGGWILQNSRSMKKNETVLEKWFMYENSTLEIRQGILVALMDDLTPTRFIFCKQLLSVCDDSELQKELYLWVLVHNIFMEQFVGREDRYKYSREMIDEWGGSGFLSEWNNARKYWDKVYEIYDKSVCDARNDYNTLFGYFMIQA